MINVYGEVVPDMELTQKKGTVSVHKNLCTETIKHIYIYI